MCAIYIDERPIGQLDCGTSYALADIPIAAKESGRSAIERVLDHGRLDDWESGKDDKARAKGARVVEFGIGKNMFGLGSYGVVVALCEALL